MSDLHERPRFFVHAGLPKTGTSYLQDILFASRSEVRDQGVALLPRRRQHHFDLAITVRGMLRDFDDPRTGRVLDRFATEVAENALPAALLTQEALAPATPEAVARLLAPLEGHDVHLVLTVRDLGRQVPSSWQQGIKGRKKVGFGDFLDAAVARTPAASDFWANQDLGEVLERWSSAIPPERIHVVTVPQGGADPTLLLRRFCSVLGLDPDALVVEAPTANPSLGHAQAELLRRVNVALGDRLPHARAGYRRVARAWLSNQVLLRQSSPRPRLPLALRPWIDEVTQGWVDHLATGGFDVVGDLAELWTPESAYVAEVGEPTENELLTAAVAALADILELRDRELDQREVERARATALARRVEELEAQVDGGALRALGRVVRRRGR